MSMPPVVSVRVITYNHAPYIAQCIEGLLMQKTDFPFEIIIGEDCSTDPTRQIVLAYQRKYPDLIQVITSDENVGAANNTRRVGQACRGVYHAFCEGDDYWIDPLKLQQQVDLMESNPDLPLCFHNAFVISATTPTVKLFFTTPPAKTLSFEQACQIRMPLASALVRSEVLRTLPKWHLQVWCPDVVLRLWSAHLGQLGYLDRIMAVRRTLPTGMVASMRPLIKKRYQDELFLYHELDKETGYRYTAALQAKLRQVDAKYTRIRQGNLYYLRHPSQAIARVRKYIHLVKAYRQW